MAAPRPSLTLCTWTCNDAALLHGLLACVAAWTVRPDAVAILDDGSDTPFALPPDLDLPPVTLLRHPTNQGVARAKHACISAATTDMVLAVDCDVRLSPDWLASVLPLLDNPAVGQASSPLRQRGDDLPARYAARFLMPSAAPPMPDHMPGPVYCIRRADWERAGGMAGHGHPTGEDVLLSRRLARLGLRPAWHTGVRADLVRRLSRRALVRRTWAWFKPCAATRRGGKKGVIAMHCDACAPRLHDHARELLQGVVRRAEQASRMGEPAFAYIELLYAAHALADRLACNAATRGDIPATEGARLRAALDAALAPWPRTLALLHADLAAMGLPLPAPATGTTTDPWPEVLREPLATLAPMLTHVEAHEAEAMARDMDEYDASFYNALPRTPPDAA